MQCSFVRDLQEFISNERVDLSECIGHVIQLGRVDEIIEVCGCHPAEEVTFTELNNRGGL